MDTCSLQKKRDRSRGIGEGLLPKSAFSLSTATTSHHKPGGNGKLPLTRQFSGDTEMQQRKMSHDFNVSLNDNASHHYHLSGPPQEGAVGGIGVGGGTLCARRQSQTESTFSHHRADCTGQGFHGGDDEEDNDDILWHFGKKGQTHTGVVKQKPLLTEQNVLAHESRHHKEKIKRIESFVSDCAKYSNPGTSGESTIGDPDEIDADHHLDKNDDLDPQTPGHGHSRDTALSKLHANLNKKVVYESQESDSSDSHNHRDKVVNVPTLDLHSVASQGQGHVDVGAGHHGNGVEGQHAARGQQGHAEGHGHRERSLSSSEVSIHTASSNDVSEDEEGGAYNSGMCLVNRNLRSCIIQLAFTQAIKRDQSMCLHYISCIKHVYLSHNPSKKMVSSTVLLSP